MKTIKPKYGICFTSRDVSNAWRNIGQFHWAQKAYERMKRQCDEFLEYSDEQIYDCVLGMQGQTFAYGISGCPVCGRPFPMEPEQQRPLFSKIEDLPVKQLKCPSCSTVFPNEQCPDEGLGIERDRKGYYLIGMWNFYMGGELLGGVRNHEGMATKLTYMYMLTGNEAYAHKAIVILDAFSAINPGTKGPRDFTPFGSDFEIGRLHLLTSIVHRVKVCLASDYDWLHDLPEMDEPSPALAALGRSGTIRANIVAMLEDYQLSEAGGPEYDLRDGNLTNLQNHESDGVRAMLAAGLMLGKRNYCEWGVRAVEAYFYNAIGRDGMYYEGSYGYSLFTGTVFLDIAMLALRASNGEQLAEFHPFACGRFFRFAVQNPLEMMCQGHLPSFGDWGRDGAASREANPKLIAETYRAALYFYQFTPDETMKAEAKRVLVQLAPLLESQLGDRGVDLFFAHPDEPAPEPFALPQDNTIMGQAGIAVLRDANGTTALMRVGPNRTHAHDDILAYQYYAFGKEISADIGYGIYGTNGHYGWASKAVAHNTVVVNCDRTMERNRIYKPFAGGEFSFVYESDRIAAMEGRTPELYGIEAYQRMLAIVPAGGASYTVDFFYVEGAETADYAFHAFHERSELELKEALPVAAGHWTLAGVDEAEKPDYDAPGLSFGERLTTGETFASLLEGEEEREWTAEPNNGYGYIHRVEEFRAPHGAAHAVWTSSTGFEHHWLGLCDREDRLFTGLGPSLEGETQHPFLIQRSVRPVKQFAAVSFTREANGEAPIFRMRPLLYGDPDVTALCVEFGDGKTDLWAYRPQDGRIKLDTQYGEWRVYGRCAWVRLDRGGAVLDAACIHGEEMTFRGQRYAGRDRTWHTIERLDVAAGTLTVSAHLPPEEPKYVRIKAPHRSGSVFYPVRSVREMQGRVTISLKDSVVLSKGIVKNLDGCILESYYPLPLGIDASTDKIASPFSGKKIKGEFGGEAVIRKMLDLKKMEIELLRPFRSGEKFDILDIEAGYALQWG